MEDKKHIHVNNLLYSCASVKQRGSEQFVSTHALGCIISGEYQVYTNEGVKVFRPGSISLVRRNQFIKSKKIPPPGGEFKSLHLFLTQDFLHRYASEYNLCPVGHYTDDYMRILAPDVFIKGYFDSLIPYFDQEIQPDSTMMELKTREAVALLLRHDPTLNEFLFDFSEPYKIDLEAFMNQNFMYNVPTEKFAKLTGRSLASFKRDFEKVFNTTPGQWLQQKRLNEALYLIKERGRKPSDVYMEVGFENLSHFSFCFKKTFGIAPSMI